MPVEGAIAAAARSTLPVTWDALATDSQRYGDGFLQTKVNLVKERLFGSVITTVQESAYALRVIDYAGKLVALEMITPGIDFWMNEVTSESATGTNEQHTYVDRAETLRKLREVLLREVRTLEPEVLPLIGTPVVLNRSVPAISSADAELLTPSPLDFGRPYRDTGR